MLIQIPNVEEGEAKKMVIKDFLREKGITEENGKLKLWCDDKSDFDKKAIKNNNDVTEYLIFKTAVSTGWDCPRAHILVKFRDSNSETFETQTIGRILRTAEAKSYGNYLLDNAYIYTNIWTFETKKDSYNPNKIKTEWSKMRDDYNRINIWNQTQLVSYYRSRQGDYNSVDSRFGKFFMEAFMNYFDLTKDDMYIGSLNAETINKLKQKGLTIENDTNDKIMSEKNIDVLAADNEINYDVNLVETKMSENDIQAQYNNIIRENISGLAYVRSKSPVTSAVIDTISSFFDVGSRNEKVSKIMRIVVNNKTIFEQLLSQSTRAFKEMIAKEAYKKGERYDFRIEEARPYSIETHTEFVSAFKSLYKPFYVLKNVDGNPINKLEEEFIKYLDNKNCVEWYWENGTELMKINFGISYNNGNNTFQPDFIVKFKNGDVGIFDTKPIDYRVEDTRIKANALYKYIKDINKNRGDAPKVVGGIVVKDRSHFYYYDKDDDYKDYSVCYNDWKPFDSLLEKIENETRRKEFERNAK